MYRGRIINSNRWHMNYNISYMHAIANGVAATGVINCFAHIISAVGGIGMVRVCYIRGIAISENPMITGRETFAGIGKSNQAGAAIY